jgi:hypothetical protein
MLGDGKDVAPEQVRSAASPSRQCSPSEVLLVQQSHQLLVIFTHGHFHTRSEHLHFVFSSLFVCGINFFFPRSLALPLASSCLSLDALAPLVVAFVCVLSCQKNQ